MTDRAAIASALRVIADALETAPVAPVHEEPSRLIPLRQSPVGYRLTLEAIKQGELRKYQVGGRSFIERTELDAWILAHPVAPRAVVAEPEHDEIDAVIAANRRRRERHH